MFCFHQVLCHARCSAAETQVVIHNVLPWNGFDTVVCMLEWTIEVRAVYLCLSHPIPKGKASGYCAPILVDKKIVFIHNNRQLYENAALQKHRASYIDAVIIVQQQVANRGDTISPARQIVLMSRWTNVGGKQEEKQPGFYGDTLRSPEGECSIHIQAELKSGGRSRQLHEWTT